MIKKEDTQTDIDRNTIIELHHIDLDTQTRLLNISNFLQKHPEIVSISYPSAELLIAEKNTKVRNAAIKRIAAEIKRHEDVDARGFRLIYRKATKNQVRKILYSERIKENPNIKTRKPKNAEILFECPFCKQLYKRNTRDKILAFRTTEKVNDTIEYLSTQCNVSRSFLIEILLKIENRFGSEFR